MWKSNAMATVSLDSIRYAIKVSKHISENEKKLRSWKQMSKIGVGLQSYQLQIETILNIVFKILALLHCSSIHILTI